MTGNNSIRLLFFKHRCLPVSFARHYRLRLFHWPPARKNNVWAFCSANLPTYQLIIFTHPYHHSFLLPVLRRAHLSASSFNFIDLSLFFWRMMEQERMKTNSLSDVLVARYGESCDHDSDCDRPFVCHRKGSSNTPGMCRCPWKYDFVKDQCGEYNRSIWIGRCIAIITLVGDLNAVCAKDTDCQRFMLCSGTEDGTRRCQCQAQFNYDEDKKRCRK